MKKEQTEASRLKFEAFVKGELGDIAVSDDSGRYISQKIQNYWRTWQESESDHVPRADAELAAYALTVENLTAERDALANAPNNDLPVALLERLAKTLIRLGYATPEGGIECFNAHIETQLYKLCRGVDSVLESISARDALAAQVKALEADAGRYRWLSAYLVSPYTQHDDAIVDTRTKDELDAVIDAAIKGAEK